MAQLLPGMWHPGSDFALGKGRLENSSYLHVSKQWLLFLGFPPPSFTNSLLGEASTPPNPSHTCVSLTWA